MDIDSLRRFRKGLGANFFGQAVNVVVQLLGVPILLHAWGAHLYGEWLILFALPAYLSVTDLGFSASAANDMSHHASSGRVVEALEVFQSTGLLIFVAASLGIILVSLFIFGLPFPWELLQLSAMNVHEAQWILWFLSAEVLCRLTEGISYAGFRASKEYALYSFLNNASRLLQFSAMWVVALSGGGPLSAAFVFFGIRMLVSPLLAVLLIRRQAWLRFGFTHARASHVRRLMGPALANFSMPVAQALNVQGMVLVVGATLGPVAVVTFSTLRTITRLALQLIFAVSHAAEPEIAAAYGAADRSLMNSIFDHSLRVALWLGVGAALGLALLGGYVLDAWTHGAVPMEWPLFYALLASALATVLWYGGVMFLRASNRHMHVALLYTVISACAVVATAVWLKLSGDLFGAGAVLLLMDGAMAIVVLRAVSQITGVDPWLCLLRAFDPRPALKLIERKFNAS